MVEFNFKSLHLLPSLSREHVFSLVFVFWFSFFLLFFTGSGLEFDVSDFRGALIALIAVYLSYFLLKFVLETQLSTTARGVVSFTVFLSLLFLGLIATFNLVNNKASLLASFAEGTFKIFLALWPVAHALLLLNFNSRLEGAILRFDLRGVDFKLLALIAVISVVTVSFFNLTLGYGFSLGFAAAYGLNAYAITVYRAALKVFNR